jgi:alanine racemase
MDAARMTDNSVISIDFDAVDHNMKVVRGLVGPGVAVNVVVKADAYGLGAAKVARRLVQSGASMLTVFSPAQAEALEGVPVPVLVLQPVTKLDRGGALHSMLVSGRLHLVVHDTHHVAELIVLAHEHGVRIPVHLELDTGLARGGCAPDEAARVLLAVAASPQLALAGVMTHFSHAKGSADRCAAQMRAFDLFVDSHRALIPPECLLHAASTFAAMRGPSMHAGMVRVGLAWTGLAGDGPEDAECAEGDDFRPAVRWTSNVIHVRRIARGASIGYGWTWTARRDSVVGLVPVGYADGYPTLCAHAPGTARDQAEPARWVRIRVGDWDAEVPVIGAVNMDQICVDLTGLDHMLAALPNGGLGAEVELYGTDRASRNYLPAVAERVGVRPYELLCRMNPRIPRVAVESAQPVGRVDRALPHAAVRAAPEVP